MIGLDELARLEEGRLALSVSEVAREFRRIPEGQGGGVMSRGEPGTWVNMASGMGLHGAVPGEVLDELVDWYTGVRVEPRVEVCPTADESLVRGLGERGFVMRLFENVFFRELGPGERVERRCPLPEEIVIEVVDPADRGAVDEFARTVGFGFAGDREARGVDLELWKRCATHERTVVVAARRGGRMIGAGSVEIAGRVAALFGLSVRPEFRRRGVQQALMGARLDLAAGRGATVATISARPGVATERNARRMGFQVGYTKVLVVKPGPGLAPVVG